ncbi:unnamed protein product [Pedinophyceae sp. YPF-701]|nr:unnamed protein product [Pedinophyceae sp. YPF-701]
MSQAGSGAERDPLGGPPLTAVLPAARAGSSLPPVRTGVAAPLPPMLRGQGTGNVAQLPQPPGRRGPVLSAILAAREPTNAPAAPRGPPGAPPSQPQPPPPPQPAHRPTAPSSALPNRQGALRAILTTAERPSAGNAPPLRGVASRAAPPPAPAPAIPAAPPPAPAAPQPAPSAAPSQAESAAPPPAPPSIGGAAAPASRQSQPSDAPGDPVQPRSRRVSAPRPSAQTAAPARRARTTAGSDALRSARPTVHEAAAPTGPACDVNFIGEVVGWREGTGKENTPVLCEWSIKLPDDPADGWTTVAGRTSGVTQVACGSKSSPVAVWAHPLDVHLQARRLATWPRINIKVLTRDADGMEKAHAYGSVALPCAPGCHVVTAQCWRAHDRRTEGREILRVFFNQEPPKLEKEEVAYSVTDPVRQTFLSTQGAGAVVLRVMLLTRGVDAVLPATLASRRSKARAQGPLDDGLSEGLAFVRSGRGAAIERARARVQGMTLEEIRRQTAVRRAAARAGGTRASAVESAGSAGRRTATESAQQRGRARRRSALVDSPSRRAPASFRAPSRLGQSGLEPLSPDSQQGGTPDESRSPMGRSMTTVDRQRHLGAAAAIRASRAGAAPQPAAAQATPERKALERMLSKVQEGEEGGS